ncbi:hypothetical protein [Actinomadura macra]|nr:hypothetical protein [Actinomadura macra]
MQRFSRGFRSLTPPLGECTRLPTAIDAGVARRATGASDALAAARPDAIL